MKQDKDLRTLFNQKQEGLNFKLKDGHKERFFEKLSNELPEEKNNYSFIYKIAASIVVLVGLGCIIYNSLETTEPAPAVVIVDDKKDTERQISLGDLSPDLKKLENYYVANINLELAHLQISEENKALIDSFMERLVELNVEYQNLNKELNTMGPNNQTIEALIKNLQLRLELLKKLKLKLNEFKSSKNETELHI